MKDAASVSPGSSAKLGAALSAATASSGDFTRQSSLAFVWQNAYTEWAICQKEFRRGFHDDYSLFQTRRFC